MAKSVTIQDVARQAGLSKSAVSRYLNHSLSLPPATAQRIEGAIEALGFRRNSLAQRLSKGGSETIGLVLPDIANPFFAELADAAEATAFAHGYNLVLCLTRNDPAREIQYVHWKGSRRVDGLLFISNRADDGTLAAQLGAYREIVLLDEDVPGTSMPKVFADNVAGGRLATEHLIRQGHRRIAHVSGPAAVMSVRERREGYERALAAAGIPLHPDYLLLGEYSRDFGRQAAATLLDLPEPPQAIFAASDFIAVGVLDTLRERGLAVPAALSLVGFDDAPYAELLTPPLSTVRQSARDLGRQGIEALLAVLAGQPVVGEQRVAVTLVERGSVAPAPAPR